MSIKYHRQEEIREIQERRKTPWMRQPHSAGRMTRRQGMFVIAGFLLSVALLSQIAIRRNQRDPYAGQPVIRGAGTITRMERADDGRGIVGLDIEAGVGEWVLGADAVIPDPYWAALKPGDRLAVVFQVNAQGTAVRVIECGIVALPGEIR